MLEQITASVKEALENDLPEIEDEVWGIVDDRAAMTGKIFRRPIEHDIEIYSFPQTWGSTGIGLSGAGGDGDRRYGRNGLGVFRRPVPLPDRRLAQESCIRC